MCQFANDIDLCWLKPNLEKRIWHAFTVALRFKPETPKPNYDRQAL